MDRLTELGIKHNTDKATGHGYTQFYYPYFNVFTNPKIMEVGVYDGGSVKMMEEFYGEPTIIGLDIEPKTQYDSKHIKTYLADQADREQLKRIVEQVGISEYDIIIDDGGHSMEQQLKTIAELFPLVKSGGIYVLEDLHTSFIGGQYNQNRDSFTAYDFVFRLSKGLESSPPYMSAEEADYILANTKSVEIYQKDKYDYLHSITSVIVKK